VTRRPIRSFLIEVHAARLDLAPAASQPSAMNALTSVLKASHSGGRSTASKQKRRSWDGADTPRVPRLTTRGTALGSSSQLALGDLIGAANLVGQRVSLFQPLDHAGA
jgi:hypothetical protein